jgi:hypothetical protein
LGLIVGQQGFDLATQAVVAGAGLAKKLAAVGRRQIGRLLKDLFMRDSQVRAQYCDLF